MAQPRGHFSQSSQHGQAGAGLQLVPVDCPLCGATQSTPWAQENGYVAVKCNGCGLVYLNPRPDDSDISAASVIGQHRVEEGLLDVNFRRSSKKLRAYRRLLPRVLKGADLPVGPISWLDVGAGYGEIMEALYVILPDGSRIVGLELNKGKAAAAQERGLDVRPDDIDTVAATFDAVSLINVFSHIPNFRHFLAKIRSVLKPGGILLVETGNGGDLERRESYPDELYLPDHVVFAGMKNIETFMREGGFRLVTHKEYRRDTLEFAARSAIKKLLGRKARLVVPYRSPFRTCFVVGRLNDS
jgi:SAM-dependent methyltransferase